MKIRSLMVILYLVVTVAGHNSWAQQWQQERYDIRWIPITEPEVERQVRANSKDAVALYRLWWRARYQDKKEAYFNALRTLKEQQPGNAVALSTYCAVLVDCRDYGRTPSEQGMSDFGTQRVRELLEQAKKLDPSLWMNYFAESKLVVYDNSPSVRTVQQLKAARKAYALAPQLSYTNTQLGYALLSEAMAHDRRLIDSAISIYKRAQHLKPVDSGPSFLLLNVHRYVSPNRSEEQKTVRTLLSTIPPGVKLNAKLQRLLVQYKIPYKGR